MSRRPYKKVLLTDSEFDVVDKIAHWTRVDESWFHLSDRDGYTAVYDMERKSWISLQFGLKLLRESFGGDDGDFVGMGVLTPKEFEVWSGIIARIS